MGLALYYWRAWAAFATSLGAVPVTVVPVPALLAGFAVLLVAGNLLAAVPGASLPGLRPRSCSAPNRPPCQRFPIGPGIRAASVTVVPPCPV